MFVIGYLYYLEVTSYWMFVLLEVTSYWMFVIGCLYIESYPGRDALLDMINGSNMKTAAVGSGKGVGCCRSSDAKPSPSKSSPPPATEEEEDVLEELLSSPPCPPVPQITCWQSLHKSNLRSILPPINAINIQFAVLIIVYY